jgi:hypothetical protein
MGIVVLWATLRALPQVNPSRVPAVVAYRITKKVFCSYPISSLNYSYVQLIRRTFANTYINSWKLLAWGRELKEGLLKEGNGCPR